MTSEDLNYHKERARQCRELAQTASDPDVRRRHAELANLHAARMSGLAAAAMDIQP